MVQNDDGIVDTAVTDRMLRRVLTFSGIPVFVALLLYPGFWYLKVCQQLHIMQHAHRPCKMQSLVFLSYNTCPVASVGQGGAPTGATLAFRQCCCKQVAATAVGLFDKSR